MKAAQVGRHSGGPQVSGNKPPVDVDGFVNMFFVLMASVVNSTEGRETPTELQSIQTC